MDVITFFARVLFRTSLWYLVTRDFLAARFLIEFPIFLISVTFSQLVQEYQINEPTTEDTEDLITYEKVETNNYEKIDYSMKNYSDEVIINCLRIDECSKKSQKIFLSKRRNDYYRKPTRNSRFQTCNFIAKKFKSKTRRENYVKIKFNKVKR